MAIQFPSNPAIGETTTQAGRVYEWDGTSWNALPKTLSFSDISNTPTSLAGYGINNANVTASLNVAGPAQFDSDVNITGDLTVTGDAFFSPDTIYVGGISISSDSDGLIVGGGIDATSISLGGSDLTSTLQSLEAGSNDFIHDSTLFPSFIETYDDAIEYTMSQALELDSRCVDSFADGINGDENEYHFKLTVTARQGGLASISDSSNIYLSGSTANINATPLAGYTFSNWSGQDISDTSTASSTVLMTGERFVVAYFTKV